jgi:CPA1 family monovalent cation:H+ antiporter
VIVGTMATVGVCISTLVIGALFCWASHLIRIPVSFMWALVFGALISPTDPVAVLSTLKDIGMPKRLQMDISGESLFNDGVGVALFSILLVAATRGSGSFGLTEFATVLLWEAVGGAVLGL